MKSIRDAINLNGAPVLLTGAMGGIGRNIAQLLVELRAEIILLDKVADWEFTEKMSALSDFPVTFFACDLEDRENREEVIEKINGHTSSLFSLINNAAFVGKSNLEGWNVPFNEQSLDTWQRVLEVNLQAPFHLAQGLFPLLENTHGANIVNMGSIYGVVGPDWRLYEKTTMANPSSYAASKGGLIQLTKWLATTLAPKVRVNALCPGGVFQNQPTSFVDEYVSRTPLKRMAKANDFNGATAFLVSPMSEYMTGQVICIDGGWTAW